jgi:hypothetical protein
MSREPHPHLTLEIFDWALLAFGDIWPHLAYLMQRRQVERLLSDRFNCRATEAVFFIFCP